MGIAERRVRQKEEVRASILAAAKQLVMPEGWQALSIRKIAEAIEYSVPVIYDHFENKEAIHLEFMKEGFSLLGDKIKKATESTTDAAAQLENISQAYWDFAFNNKEYYQLMYGVGMPTCETIKQVPELQIFAEQMFVPIKALIAKSSDPDANYYLKFHSLWSLLHGLISINMVGKSGAPDSLNEMILKDSVASFIKGISL